VLQGECAAIRITEEKDHQNYEQDEAIRPIEAVLPFKKLASHLIIVFPPAPTSPTHDSLGVKMV